MYLAHAIQFAESSEENRLSHVNSASDGLRRDRVHSPQVRAGQVPGASPPARAQQVQASPTSQGFTPKGSANALTSPFCLEILWEMREASRGRKRAREREKKKNRRNSLELFVFPSISQQTHASEKGLLTNSFNKPCPHTCSGAQASQTCLQASDSTTTTQMQALSPSARGRRGEEDGTFEQAMEEP